MVAFRKRFPASAMAEINEAIIAKDHKDLPPADDDNDGDGGNSGTLILDATCAPADIHFPTDAGIQLYEQQKYLERSEAGERNAIEGKFGEAKNRYGLNRVMARLSDTNDTVIHMTILVMNLKKRLRNLFDFFSHLSDFLFPVLSFEKFAVKQ